MMMSSKAGRNGGRLTKQQRKDHKQRRDKQRNRRNYED